MNTSWHTYSIEDILSELKTNLHGLNHEQVKERLQQYGLNRLITRKGPGLFQLLLRQLLNPLVFILVITAIIKFTIADPLVGSVITFTILIMISVGFFQELKAERALQTLKNLYTPQAKVKRANRVELIHTDQIVPGDLIVLESGDHIPADCRIIEAFNFKINESSLTGEPISIEKHTGPLNEKTPLAERSNMAYMGTSVTTGKAEAVCVASGMETELGKIATAIEGVKQEKTPLQKSIHALGLWMSICVFIVIGIFAAIALYRGYSWFDVLLFALSASVAAIPEGLPAAVTIVLATGVHVMAKKNAIIRRLSAVETLGSTTLIASDKTGTLTLNQMKVNHVFLERDDDRIAAFQVGALANDAYITKENDHFEVVGDPTEAALLIAAEEAGFDLHTLKTDYPRLDEIPFESSSRYMATLHQTPEGKKIFVKGAPEKLLQFTNLPEEEKERLEHKLEKIAEDGLRLIAVGALETTDERLSESSINGKLNFLGAFALIDPPREEAIASIEACHAAGIRVIMITGDNKKTAKKIAHHLGILSEEDPLSSTDIEHLSEKQLDERVKKVNLFARIEPLHKLKIVQAFKRLGHIVAMTGDGVNDAPALEAADIGVSMGITGTDVAKEAAEMILVDDNFSSIVTAIEEGRAIFNRLRNTTTFLLTTSLGELFGLLLCIAFTGQILLTPLQILWVNLVTGVLIALAIANEPKTGDELKQPPRSPEVKLLFPGMILRIASISFFLGLFSFLIFSLFWDTLGLTVTRTMVFSSIVIFEWLIAFNMRSDEKTLFHLGIFTNKRLFLSIGAGLILQLLLLYVPLFRAAFDTHPLSWIEWVIVLIPGLFIFSLETLRKILFPGLFNRGKWRRGSSDHNKVG